MAAGEGLVDCCGPGLGTECRSCFALIERAVITQTFKMFYFVVCGGKGFYFDGDGAWLAKEGCGGDL